MKQISSFFFRFVITLTVLVNTVARLDLSRGYLGVSSLVLATLMLIVGLTLGFRAGWVLGFILAFTPLLTTGSFHLVWASFLFGHAVGSLFEEAPKKELNNPAREMLLTSMFVATAAFLLPSYITYLLNFDAKLVTDVVRAGGILGFQQYWSSEPGSFSRALHTLCGYLLILCHVETVSAEENMSRAIRSQLHGMITGFVLSLLILAGQISSLPFFISGNFTQYWRTLRQYPAAATDPNALAIAALLLFPMVPLCLSGNRNKHILVMFSLFGLGLFSGSRTFVLGMLIMAAVLVFRWVWRQRKRELTICYSVGLFCAVCSGVLLGYPPVNNRLQQVINFPAAVRSLKTIHWQDSSSMFSSRAIFGRVALMTWRESPIVGVGLERFFAVEQAAMERLGINLGGWLDNANNFYLQVLAECGILGLCLIVLSIILLVVTTLVRPVTEEEIEELTANTNRRFPSAEFQGVSRVVLLVFGVLLLTGPHLLSPEVQYLFALVVTAGFLRPVVFRRFELRQVRCGALVILFLFSAGYMVVASRQFHPPRSWGFYPADDTSRPEIRWSGSRARIELCENTEDTVRFRIRSLKPHLGSNPVKVYLHEGEIDIGDTTQNIELTNSEWLSVIVPLRPDQDGRFPRAVVNLHVTPLFSPAQLRLGDDPRWLGVQVELPHGTC